MRILIVAGLAGPGPVAGGVWTVALHQASRLAEVGQEVTLLGGWLGQPSQGEIAHTRAKYPQINFHFITVQPPIKRLGLRLLWSHKWRAAVRRHLANADALFVHLCRDYMTMSSVMTAPTELRVLAQTHGMLRRTDNPAYILFDRLVTRRVVQRIGRFICFSAEEQKDLAGIGISQEATLLLPNTLTDPAIRWNGPPTGPPRLLFASRLHPRKQVLVFAQAILDLNTEGIHVLGDICGSDEGDLPALMHLMETHPHSPALNYLGPLNQSEVARRMCESTAVVFPALNEPYGMIPIEALSVGCPLICSDQTPIAQAIDDFGAAIVTSPELGDMKDAIRMLLADKSLAMSLSESGRQLFEQRWSDKGLGETLRTTLLEM